MVRALTAVERGRLIAAAREAKGWSQVRLAAEVGVQPSLINKIEHGVLSGSVDTIVSIGVALDMDLNLLKAGLRPEAVPIAHSQDDADPVLQNEPTGV